MPWLEIMLVLIAMFVAFATGLSSSPFYSSKEKERSEKDMVESDCEKSKNK